MAITLNIHGGVQFAESTIVAEVTVSGEVFPAGASMQRCVLIVKNGREEQEFGWDAVNNSSYKMDISSAIRAFLPDYDTLSMALNGGTLPTARCTFGAYVSYLLGGDLYGRLHTEVNFDSYYVDGIHGGLSDWDRFIIGGVDNPYMGTQLKDVILSKKPHVVEYVKYGTPYPTAKIVGNGVTVTKHSLKYDQNGTIRKGGLKVIDDNNMTSFCFRNSLGVPETVSARSLQLEQIGVDGSESSIVGETSFAPSGKIIHVSTNDYTQYEMSSGYVSKEWARWWASEFLQAREHWMLMDGKWWPVSIAPKGNVIEIIDRAKPGMCHVDFIVKMAYSGANTDWMK